MILTDVSEMNIDLFGSFRDARACAKKAMIPLIRYGNEGELDTAAIFFASPTSSYYWCIKERN